MSEDGDTKVAEEIDEDLIENEARIDDNAVKMFQSMGQKTRLSDNAVNIYKAFKSKKDKIQPGRLSAEGYAFVFVLAEMFDGKLKPE